MLSGPTNRGSNATLSLQACRIFEGCALRWRQNSLWGWPDAVIACGTALLEWLPKKLGPEEMLPPPFPLHSA